MPHSQTFGPWPESVHTLPDQVKSFQAAQKPDVTPLSVDPALQSGVFSGSGKNPYSTTLSACTCNSFVKRKKPCKHMYRLALELGLMDGSFKAGVPKGVAMSVTLDDAVCAIEALSTPAQLHILSMLSHTSAYKEPDFRHAHIPAPDFSLCDELRTCMLLAEHPATPEYIFSKLDKPTLYELVASHIVGKPPRKNASKQSLIDWLLQNAPEVSSQFPFPPSFSFIDPFDRAQVNTYKYLCRKYENGSIYDDQMNHYEYPSGSTCQNLSPSESSFSFGVPKCSDPSLLNSSPKNPNAFYFPDDHITELLNQYNCNRCLNGYIPDKK